MARRAGTTSSSALQMVGVSNAFRASRSAESGRRGMAASSDDDRRGPAFIGIGPRHQGFSATKLAGWRLAFRGLGAAADQQTERNDQRQNDEPHREAAFGQAPSPPVGNPIPHVTVPPSHSRPFGRDLYDRPA